MAVSVLSAVKKILIKAAPIRIEGGAQHYAWGEQGSNAFIPQLLGTKAKKGELFAELWLGAHPALPAQILETKRSMSLDQLIKAAPEQVLGRASLKAFGPQLPYLVKVLAVHTPLSLQAHPNKQQAIEGYRLENKRGITLGSPDRIYQDSNHKPELLIALTPFYALACFRPYAEIAQVLRRYPELKSILPSFPSQVNSVPKQSFWTRKLYRQIMLTKSFAIEPLSRALIAKIKAAHAQRPFAKKEIEYWMLKADASFGPEQSKDRALIAFLLLNLVELQKGKALYLEPGELHTYLAGVGVEVMANSENVLRGGLTVKPVHIEPLLKIVSYNNRPPLTLKPDRAGRYYTPAKDFKIQLTRWRASEKMRKKVSGAEILLLLAGRANVNGLNIKKGDALFVPANVGFYEIKSLTQGTACLNCSVF